MPSAKERAIDLYMGAIRDGDARAALDRNIGDRYTQHSTGVKDGKEGFLEFFEPFLDRNPVRQMEVRRALQDGRHVFLNAYQSLNDGEAEWVTADFFDSDADGRIVEHWDVIAPHTRSEANGRSNINGPTEITDLYKTEANKALVRGFVEEVLIARTLDAAPTYISAAQFIRHSPDTSDGLAGFLKAFAPDEGALTYDEIFLLVGEGNFVAVMCRVTRNGAPYCQVDLFRVESGKIVEHWDLSEPVPPADEWVNSGKF